MSMKDEELVAVIDAGGVRLELRRLYSSGGDSTGYAVGWAGHRPIQLPANPWDVPSLALIGGWAAFWIATRVCVAALADSEVFTCDAGEEVVTVMRAGVKQWLVVTELGAELRSDDLVGRLARYEHGEIVLSAALDPAGQVVLRDLDGHVVRLGLPDLDVL